MCVRERTIARPTARARRTHRRKTGHPTALICRWVLLDVSLPHCVSHCCHGRTFAKDTVTAAEEARCLECLFASVASDGGARSVPFVASAIVCVLDDHCRWHVDCVVVGSLLCSPFDRGTVLLLWLWLLLLLLLTMRLWLAGRGGALCCVDRGVGSCLCC